MTGNYLVYVRQCVMCPKFNGKTGTGGEERKIGSITKWCITSLATIWWLRSINSWSEHVYAVYTRFVQLDQGGELPFGLV